MTFGFLLVLTILWSRLSLAAEETESGVTEPSASAVAPTQTIAPEKLATYALLLQEELELTAQQRLFSLLSEERRGRAEAADRAGNSELARWEAELAHDFQARSASTLSRLTDLAKQRVAFEKANNLPLARRTEAATTLQPSLLMAEEAVYLQRIDQRLGLLQDELRGMQETQAIYILQLQTNTTPEEVSRVSWFLEDSNRAIRDLQRQQSDLQLKKLEYRALKTRS